MCFQIIGEALHTNLDTSELLNGLNYLIRNPPKKPLFPKSIKVNPIIAEAFKGTIRLLLLNRNRQLFIEYILTVSIILIHIQLKMIKLNDFDIRKYLYWDDNIRQ